MQVMVKALVNLVKKSRLLPSDVLSCSLFAAQHMFCDQHLPIHRHLKTVSSDPTTADVDKQDAIPDGWRRLFNLFEVIKATM